MRRRKLPDFFRCDDCGQLRHISEFVDTIEEMLCQWCASGLPEEWELEDDENDGQEET